MLRKLVVILLIAALATPLAGCGRKAQLDPQPGSTFPKTYPTQ